MRITPVCYAIVASGISMVSIAGNTIDVDHISSFLKTNSLLSFECELRHHQWTAPMIHSKWHVNRIHYMALRTFETRARDFGFLLATKLSDSAQKVNSDQLANVYENEAKMLLRLGKWLAKNDGYGNLLLANRCFDISHVAIAKMIIDLTCPASNIEEVLSEFDMSWYKPETVANVINQELGKRIVVFDPHRNADSDSRVSELEEIWAEALWLCEYGKAASNSHHEISLNQDFILNNKLFFADQKCLVDETLTGRWDRTRHRALIGEIPIARTVAQGKRLKSFLYSVKQLAAFLLIVLVPAQVKPTLIQELMMHSRLHGLSIQTHGITRIIEYQDELLCSTHCFWKEYLLTRIRISKESINEVGDN